MFKLKNGGLLNEDSMLALVRQGPNYVAMLSNGRELVIDADDAAALIESVVPTAPSGKKA
jgi:hypothetical protein